MVMIGGVLPRLFDRRRTLRDLMMFGMVVSGDAIEPPIRSV